MAMRTWLRTWLPWLQPTEEDMGKAITIKVARDFSDFPPTAHP